MMNALQEKPLISFVIPAHNEENCIAKTILSIRRYAPSYSYQIIVVDNGSTDHTGEIVKSTKATLIRRPIGTIASARNIGVLSADGQVIVFLDADVLLTDAWQQESVNTVERLMKNPLLIIGSRCDVSNKNNWLSRYWFSRMLHEKPNYINSGHLITSRVLFDSIGGFNEELQSAEDYDFCMRAQKIGAEIMNNPKLRAIHTGYPDNLKDFVLREKWHGSEDFKCLYSILKSKIALIAILNITLLFSFLALAISYRNVIYIVPYFILMYLLSCASTYVKFGFGNLALFLVTSFIFYFYYLGRSLALLDSFKRIVKSVNKQ